MRGKLMVALAVAVVSALPAQAKTVVVCTPISRSWCGAEGCSQGEVGGTYVWIEPEAKTYSRCDGKSCDTYTASFNVSGIFVNMEVPGRSMIAKLSTETMLGLAAMVSHGRCQRHEMDAE